MQKELPPQFHSCQTAEHSTGGAVLLMPRVWFPLVLIGTTDRSSQEAKKPPVLMSAFDEYRTALSQSQQLHQANVHGCEHEKRARAQAPKKGCFSAGMGHWSSTNGQWSASNGTSQAPLQCPLGCGPQSSAESSREPGGHCSISYSYLWTATTTRLLGMGHWKAFLSPVET